MTFWFLSHFPYIVNTTESNHSVNFRDKSIKLATQEVKEKIKLKTLTHF